jgi:acetylornithine deacetylase/succinyl-diaminopimelate desuccinylase-like protein
VTRQWAPQPAPPSPRLPELWQAVEQLTQELWPGVVVVPLLLPAATDGRALRAAGIPTYGVSGLFVELDEATEHSRDEHLGVKQFYEGREFLYRLIKLLSSSPGSRPLQPGP